MSRGAERYRRGACTFAAMPARDLVLLHGFAATARAWDGVIDALDPARQRAIPLSPADGASFGEAVRAVLAAAPDRFALCGYSLGGRIALHVALAAPERVERLVLVSSTAGIDDPGERAARRDADERLATFAEQAGIEAFADRWQAQPLFAGTSPGAAARWRDDILRCDPEELAGTLRALGTGRMQPLWTRLGELTMPVVVVVGEQDGKFAALGRRLAAAFPDARLEAIPGAGHGIPREAPEQLARILAS
jgi:2-succinyl-6-hydroxy-2,4-cyclohexadiene-1-carboxylate synthase